MCAASPSPGSNIASSTSRMVGSRLSASAAAALSFTAPSTPVCSAGRSARPSAASTSGSMRSMRAVDGLRPAVADERLQRVEADLPAGLQRHINAARGPAEPLVLRLGVEYPYLTPEDDLARAVGFHEAGLASTQDAEHGHVVAGDGVRVEGPGVVAEPVPAVHLAPDEHAALDSPRSAWKG